MEKEKNFFLENELLKNTVLDVNSKEISGQIFLHNYSLISLSDHESDPEFLQLVLTNSDITKVLNVYLNFLEKRENEKFQRLQKNNFDPEEVFKSFCSDLKSDSQKYSVILFIVEEKKRAEEKELSPLEKVFNNIFFQSFCKGLGLSEDCKKLFILALLNRDWGWLFPSSYSDEYKAKLFCSICNIKSQSEVSYTRKLNNELINLNLFSDAWTVEEFVYSFFIKDNPSFTVKPVVFKPNQDLYSYEDMGELNKKNFYIMFEQVHEYKEDKKGCFMLIKSESDFRNKNFIASLCEDSLQSLYEIRQEFPHADLTEFSFYLYAYSVTLQNSNGIFFLSKNLADNYLLCEERRQENSSNVLKAVKVPVIISSGNFEKDKKHALEKHGVDLLYWTNLKLPGHRKDKTELAEYFFEQQLSPDLISVAVDKVEELKLEPDKWVEFTNVLKHTEFLNAEERSKLLSKKYSPHADNIRKNLSYCLEALNTSYSVKELTEMLQAANDSMKEEADQFTGIRILLSGLSGTGKTAYVENVSALMGRPLIIIRASEIISPYVGETEQNIKAAFDNATEKKAILLIDEADSFIHSRGDSLNRHNDLKVNEFLIQMERFPGILFCNTNLAESLDKATDRRFNLKVDFKPLTKDGVNLLCKSYFKDLKISPSQVEKIYQSGDVTPGDFGALSGRIKFMKKEKVNAAYVTEELCKIVHGKTRSWENHRIGF